MSRRLWLVVALVCSLFACPVSAYAEDGFIGGLQDFAGVREVEQVEPEKDFQESYEPVLLETETREVSSETPDEGETQGFIQSVVTALSSIKVDNTIFDMVGFARWFLIVYVAGAAAVLAFFWWGVRKALRMIMSAWRKGHASV